MLFTSESVTRGHPDKICDQIADYILYLCLEQDPASHVACEVCCTTGTVILMGEITTNAIVDYKAAARVVLEDIGYTNTAYGIDPNCSVIDLIDKQSPEIDSAVTYSYESRNQIHDYYDSIGAGDQGIMFGYACDETEALMPLSIYLADRLARKLDKLSYGSNILRPDGKTQVTVAYDDNGAIDHIDTILISAQHHPCDKSILEKFIKTRVIGDVIDECSLDNLITSETKLIINPSGSFTIGGPHGDTGLTGRKLAVDTYGGHARFGGGAMSGKDPTKVDRSAAYMARYAAKHIVAAGLAKKCEIQVSYSIGMSKPVSINVNTFGTSGVLPDGYIKNIIDTYFDFRPGKIVEFLKLVDTSAVNYYDVAKGCHFGNNKYPWEFIDNDIIASLKAAKSEYLGSYCN